MRQDKSKFNKKNQYFEQSATLFGMRKKDINQNFLSQFWYIGQIYTIPNLNEEETGKTIAQISIWKCGLGNLDIVTQLNSLEVKWI